MKPHESPRIRKKSIRDDSGDSWPVLNRGISKVMLVVALNLFCVLMKGLLASQESMMMLSTP